VTDLRKLLNYQSDVIEATLMMHRAPGVVTGGVVGPRLVQFRVQPGPGVRYSAIASLRDDLALALRTDNLTVDRDARGVVITLPRGEARRVRLLDLLDDAPAGTAALGMTATGAPLYVKLSSPDVAHALIAGTTGSGKSVLLRTIAASLVLTRPAEELRLVCIDAKGRLFAHFAGVPHLLRPPLCDGPEIREVLRSLVHLMEVRDRSGESAPRIVVCIDELADVVMTVDGSSDLLTRLLQRGRESGIHVVGATQHPSAAILGSLMRANFPLRLIGRVASADDARVASGQAGSGAHLLAGRGDFVAVHGGAVTRFQAAHADELELDEQLGLTRSMARPGGYVLPEAPAQDDGAHDEIATLAEQLAPWWSEHGNAWGSKTRACRRLFGDDVRYGGYHAQKTDQVIAYLETTSSSQRAHTESARAGGNGHTR